jgi:Cys-rich protein (TIGR01571 family)
MRARAGIALAVLAVAAQAKQRPQQQPPQGGPADGDWRCCWGIDSCAEFSAASCPPLLPAPPAIRPGPPAPAPAASRCATQRQCTGACSSKLNRTLWCRQATVCEGNSATCPPSASDGALRQPIRPPRQTAAQAAAMRKIEAQAVKASAAAEPWVLSYFSSETVRSVLHPSLQNYSSKELLDMFAWEFQRLPLIHNAPVDAWDVDRAFIEDDSPMDVTLSNMYIQQPCQRYVLGGPESLWRTLMYGNMYSQHFDLAVDHLCDLTASLRQSNDCLLYNANNLRKTSMGNTMFGGVTYVLNQKALAGRSFWEPVDGGMMTFTDLFVEWKWPKTWWNWQLGTTYPPAFYHLLQPHEQVFGMQSGMSEGGYQGIGAELNRWWVEGAPLPQDSTLPYFEVMTSNVWLPEDMTTAIAKYSSGPDFIFNGRGAAGAPGLWGTTLGTKLRQWMATNGRPLLWADDADGPMLLDPLVAKQLGGAGGANTTQQVEFSHNQNITAADLQLFETAWAAPSWPNGSFNALAGQAAPHLHFQWQGWNRRKACEPAERASAANILMGTDANGRCVYWSPAKTKAKTKSASWECLNDGTCARSRSPNAVFSAEASCLAQCAHSWTCTRRQTNVSRDSGSAYCIPSLPATAAGAASAAASAGGSGHYTTLAACEVDCSIDDSDRAWLCHDWEAIVITALCLLVTFYSVGFCAAVRVLAPRQKQFGSPMFRGCLCCLCNTKGRDGFGAGVDSFGVVVVERRCFLPVPWWDCLWYTCCPCFQCIRVLGFLLGRNFGLCLCGVFVCCLPCCLPLYCIGNFLFGCVCSTGIRYKLRKRLGIEGTICEDVAIHCFARGCAQCQEARALKAGHTGYFYSGGIDQQVVAPLSVVSQPLLGGGGARSSQAGTELVTPLLAAAGGGDAEPEEQSELPAGAVRRTAQPGSELVTAAQNSDAVADNDNDDEDDDENDDDNQVMERATIGGAGAAAPGMVINLAG